MENSKYPSRALQDAVEAISSLPGIGRRGALRLALHLLKQPQENVNFLAGAIAGLAEGVRYCSRCMMLCDSDVCEICADTSRDHRQICVVESVRDVMSIEATGQYHGVYHVLGGVISPINGTAPSDLNIPPLLSRLSEAESHGDETEVILALSGDVEGETTSFYLYRQISPFKVRVTTLARGLGFGDDLEYADSLTLGRSILSRQPFNP